MSTYSLRHLSDEAVSRELDTFTAADQRSTAAHIARIAEYDRRGLYLPAGYPSMFRFCVDKLGLSEDVALQRIRAGRAALEHPSIFAAIADGSLHVTGVLMIAPFLNRGDATDLISASRRRTIKQIRRMLAERFGPGGLTPRVSVGTFASEEDGATTARGPATSDELVLKRVARPAASAGPPPEMQSPGPVGADLVAPATAEAGTLPRRARVLPVAPGRFELVAILGQQAYDQLVASRELLGHAVPSGDLADVLERAIALQFAQLRKRRCGATDRPRSASPRRSTDPRHVSAAVRRAVWERDGSRCAFVGTGGHRCDSRDRLEIDHVVPVARGGQATLGNLRLLCRAHNQHAAERALGPVRMQGMREASRRRRIEERMRREAQRGRVEDRRAALVRQSEELGEALRMLGYRGEDLRRALAHCAERAGAPPEERLKHALASMAPNARRERPFPSATTPGSPGGPFA